MRRLGYRVAEVNIHEFFKEKGLNLKQNYLVNLIYDQCLKQDEFFYHQGTGTIFE